ncbi:MAG: hypothetical protein WCH34_04900 [Bacteroidota bacterium]
MKKELFDVIMNWVNDPILGSNEFKSFKTCNEEAKPIIYAYFRFMCKNTKIEIEKKLSLFEITPEVLKSQLYEIDNSLNINEISNKLN